DTAARLWRVRARSRAKRAGAKGTSGRSRCRLEPMRRVARMVRNNLWGILNAIALRVTNAGAESLNAKIQWIKDTACGFRNRERFKNAIYFHCGKLDLHPDRLRTTHTTS